MDKIYVVKCMRFGSDVTIFATTSGDKALKYQTKFNRILKKWKGYYAQYEGETLGERWLKGEYEKQHYERWSWLGKIGVCFIEEVEAR